MGVKLSVWQSRTEENPHTVTELLRLIESNRSFTPVSRLEYGDYGLNPILECLGQAISQNKRIALYADYDVDGTMSCVSWIWFFKAIGFQNYVHYIPCRFNEGYGVNIKAVQKLIHEHRAEVIMTMDTGITANEEAAYAKSQGVSFICTDHHKIQPEKMPDCLILNPKLHPDVSYQELCGCGITFVLIRQLAQRSFPFLNNQHALWTDLLALCGMATICDIVPLNPVNHRLARLGVESLVRSHRPVLRQLRQASTLKVDERDVGFRLGPRINAVGRLEHADAVIKAFVDEDPAQLIGYMEVCNDLRRKIQSQIVIEAREQALEQKEAPVLFLGGDWHPGVVGIAASKIAEEFWKPTWVFQRKGGMCKGSARSIRGFDVTLAMGACGALFDKFGGHRAAGGYTFKEAQLEGIQDALNRFAADQKAREPDLWKSRADYDCELQPHLLRDVSVVESLGALKPFGHGFEEPRFLIRGVIEGMRWFKGKNSSEVKHTGIDMRFDERNVKRVMFFNEVLPKFVLKTPAQMLVTLASSSFQGRTELSLYGYDVQI